MWRYFGIPIHLGEMGDVFVLYLQDPKLEAILKIREIFKMASSFGSCRYNTSPISPRWLGILKYLHIINSHDICYHLTKLLKIYWNISCSSSKMIYVSSMRKNSTLIGVIWKIESEIKYNVILAINVECFPKFLQATSILHWLVINWKLAIAVLLHKCVLFVKNSNNSL